MPSYEFNHFTGRLKESTHFQPLHPISATPLYTSDPPKMIYDTSKTKPVSVPNAKLSSGGGSGGCLPEKMLKTMAEYQRKIDTPVYIIRGTPDKILFGATVFLVAVGCALTFQGLISAAFPRKAQ